MEKINKVAFITGSTKRIGAVLAKHFHSCHYNVILHYRSDNNRVETEALVRELNNLRAHSAACIQLELEKLSDDKISPSIINEIVSLFGRLDVLVNNASSFFATPIGQADLRQWRDLMISNVGGPFFLSQGLAPILKKYTGSIINISDIHATRPLKGYPIYSIAKAANNMLTKTLARELAPEIRVNGVAPGSILGPVDADEKDYPEINAKLIAKTVLKRLGTPEDIAKTVLFLAENESITGQIIAVDAGRSIRL